MQSMLMIGLFITLAIIVLLSAWSGKKTGEKSCKNGGSVVVGILIGTLVGGSSTVGTAQLAFTYGMSALWFNLGGGISLLVLALIYVKPLRNSGCMTLVEIISNEYGLTAGILASVLNAIGTFISIVSQIISSTAVIEVVFPNLELANAVIISSIAMVLYVVFGGIKGAGIVGLAKTALLYFAMIGCGALVLSATGGIRPFVHMVSNIENTGGINLLSLFARGIGVDLGAALSLLLGVLTTQTYAQAVFTSKNEKTAKKGTIISAVLVPPIGIGGVFVGLYMRANAVKYPGLTAKTALTTFVTEHISPVMAGVILATLFIASVGAGAGLALGISTVVNRDIISNFTHRFDKLICSGMMEKVCIIVIISLAASFSCGPLGDVILKLAFMSMGLRAAVVFCPLCGALFLHGRIKSSFSTAAIIIGPSIVFIGNMVNLKFDPLFLGVAMSFVVCALGYEKNSQSLKYQRFRV